MNPWLAMALVWVFVAVPVGCLVGMYPGWLVRRDMRRRRTGNFYERKGPK